MEKDVKGNKLKEGYSRCTQTLCGYYTQGGCKNCKVCGAEPYLIKNDCTRCTDCRDKPGSLRWDEDKKAKEKMIKKQFVDEMRNALDEFENQDFEIEVEQEKPKKDNPMEVIQ